MKKRILSIFILIGLILSLFACEPEYPPVESTKEELQTVMTFTIEGETYNVPYELYRAFFLLLKDEIDGGDSSVWSGKDKDEYIEKIDKRITENLSEIYSVFHVAKRVGIDLYSEENEEALDNYIKAGVEGGIVDSMSFEGFGGDYNKYLEFIKELNFNYSAHRTMLRWALGSELIDYYYIGDSETEGELKYTEDDVRDFYFGDDSARVIEGYFAEGSTAFTKDELISLRNEVAAAESEEAAALLIINKSLTVGDDILRGSIIGKYSRPPLFYSELTEAALSLSVGECAELIEVSTAFENGYYIIYKAEKSEENFEQCYDEISRIYLKHRIGKLLSEAQDTLIKSARITDTLKNLDRAEVKMK